MNKNIGAQYYTIRDFTKTKEDFDKACERVAAIGYKLVQLSGIGDIAPEDIRKILDKHGLTAVCTHRPPQEYEGDLDKLIAWHKTVGCKIAGLGAMPGFNAKPETINTFIEKYKPIAARLHEAGLIFAYHNHAFEFEKVSGRYVFDYIAESLDVSFILDAYWLAYAGINPAEFIRQYKGRIPVIHFKDLAIVNNTVKYAEIGNGNINWDAVIEACEDAGVEYALVEQDVCDGDPFDSLKISYDYLAKKGFS